MWWRIIVDHLRRTAEHGHVSTMAVTVEMQRHLWTLANVVQAMSIRAGVNEDATGFPDEPHRIGLRCSVSADSREPDDLLGLETLAYARAK